MRLPPTAARCVRRSDLARRRSRARGVSDHPSGQRRRGGCGGEEVADWTIGELQGLGTSQLVALLDLIRDLASAPGLPTGPPRSCHLLPTVPPAGSWTDPPTTRRGGRTVVCATVPRRPPRPRGHPPRAVGQLVARAAGDNAGDVWLPSAERRALVGGGVVWARGRTTARSPQLLLLADATPSPMSRRQRGLQCRRRAVAARARHCHPARAVRGEAGHALGTGS